MGIYVWKGTLAKHILYSVGKDDEVRLSFPPYGETQEIVDGKQAFHQLVPHLLQHQLLVVETLQPLLYRLLLHNERNLEWHQCSWAQHFWSNNGALCISSHNNLVLLQHFHLVVEHSLLYPNGNTPRSVSFHRPTCLEQVSISKKF